MAQNTMVGASVVIDIPTAEGMRVLGKSVAHLLQSGDVVLLSGPLGAGKTTFVQGIGRGLRIEEAIVSPTFTIARELNGSFIDGSHARLIHVDAYRIGGVEHAPGSDVATALLDELESLGLDEELENPSEGSIVLMEWGEHMAGILSDERLEISIDRSTLSSHETGLDIAEGTEVEKLTEQGVRRVVLNPVGERWLGRQKDLESLVDATMQMGHGDNSVSRMSLENGDMK